MVQIKDPSTVLIEDISSIWDKFVNNFKDRFTSNPNRIKTPLVLQQSLSYDQTNVLMKIFYIS